MLKTPIQEKITGAGGLLNSGAWTLFFQKIVTQLAAYTYTSSIFTTTKLQATTAAGYISSDGSAGATGTFTTADAKTVTVKDGIITSIV
jgi:hypothetical protein